MGVFRVGETMAFMMLIFFREVWQFSYPAPERETRRVTDIGQNVGVRVRRILSMPAPVQVRA